MTVRCGKVRTTEGMVQKSLAKRLQQLLCPTCTVWGCAVVLKDHTSRQMSSSLPADGLTQLSQCACALTVAPRGMNSTWMTPLASQCSDAITFPADLHSLIFLVLGEFSCFHCFLASFVRGVKWSNHVLSPVTTNFRNSLPSSLNP
jgi:hypothetical protein